MKLLSKIQQELVAPKNQMNKFGGYNYRSCEDIMAAVKHLLGEGILVVTDSIELIGDRYYVKATATLTEGGNTVSAVAYARETETKKGMDAAQVTGAASSYARKYALNGLFCIDDTKDPDATNNGIDDKKPDRKTPKPKEPTKTEQAVIEKICVALEKETGKIVSRKRVSGIFFAEKGTYPKDAKMAMAAANFIINLKRENEWAEEKLKEEKPKEIKPNAVNKIIEQVWFEFNTVNTNWLADHDGKLVFDKDKFIKAIQKKFNCIPADKTPQEISAAIKPEDVAIEIKEDD